MGSGKLHALKGIDLEIKAGEFLSIMGPSGSGKSTLLNILGILDGYDEGSYYLSDTLIKNLSEKKAAYYRNRLIGFVFQSYNLLPFKTALDNISLPLFYQGVNRNERNKRAYQYLEMVGLTDWALHHPTELSGGQNQRVAIARALITKPQFILADEPTGNLDTQTSDEIMQILKDINSEGITIIIVTHENEVAEQCKRIIKLRDGLIEFDSEESVKYEV